MSEIDLDAIWPYFHALTAMVTAASAISALTPNKTDDEIVNFGLKVLRVLALNVFKANGAWADNQDKADPERKDANP